ncbi:MAG: ATP-binding cassette domain-containing protein [Treponema sp.]|nr:ATP-binding cassette domain-containing protein [Treponema sp.]
MNIGLENICKSYKLKTVLQDVSLNFQSGKIHALLGENGAGKTTLAKILSGSIQMTKGKIFIDDHEVTFKSEADAIKAGISIVQQRPLLASSLNAWENVQLAEGKKIHREKLEELQKLWAPSLNLNTKIRDLGGNHRFYAALLSALIKDPSCLILDEPSAFLDSKERDFLYSKLKEFCANGRTVIVITHSMAEAAKHADTVRILKDGVLWRDYQSAKEFSEQYEKESSRQSENLVLEGNSSRACLSFIHASSHPQNKSALLDASIKVNYAEITAVLGLKEAAIDTLENLICGIETEKAKGTVEFTSSDGNTQILDLQRKKYSTAFLRKHNAAIIPSDKTFRAANPGLTVAEMLSTYQKKFSRDFCLSLINEAKVNIQPEESCSNLSGGMLQRLIVARELSTNPKLVILCNPLHGLDVESQAELVKKTVRLANDGAAVLIVGAQDFPLTICNRVYSLEQGYTHLSFSKEGDN